MACRLQKLFGADGDLADEDFLSAVEDAENRFSAPGPSRCRPPAASEPGSVPVAPGPRPLRQLHRPPGKPSGLRPLSRQSDQATASRDPGSPGAPARAPRRPSDATAAGPPAWGTAPEDELDNDIFLAACMELEVPDLPAQASAARADPGWPEMPPRPRAREERGPEPAARKKLRVGEELVTPGIPQPEGPRAAPAESGREPLPAPRAEAAPKLRLRPSAAGACSSWPAPVVPAAPPLNPGASWDSVPSPRGQTPRPFQASPCQLGANGSSAVPRVPQSGGTRSPMPQAPRQSCPGPPGSGWRPPHRLPANPQPLMSCVEPPPRQPPREATLQTPVVTNHLVQLVTAASRAPRGAPRVPAQGKTRRFPGPAGILPQQQHAGKHLEEILVSTPQTPAHGALAKLRTEELPGSSPPTEEDFGKGPWLAMKTELGLDERDPSCFLRTYSVVMVLRKAALKQLPKNKVPSMAVLIKTLTRTNVDAGAVFKDPTGEMQGTVHRLLLEERQSELKPGSVLLLKQAAARDTSESSELTPNHRCVPAGGCLLPIPPQPLPQCDTQQPAQDLPTRDRGQLLAAITRTANGHCPGWVTPGPSSTDLLGCPCPWGLGTIQDRKPQHRAVAWRLFAAPRELQAWARRASESRQLRHG
ncbi:homologous recombination OB-fold protein isoform X2 [Struthio camelus]|uniref:homologous recombination OB-fold protein isoform X2 n=1 Tax=Struthio camelus TaxID=8801 RepID=UPI003603AEB5